MSVGGQVIRRFSGDNDEIGLTDEERSDLEACADVTLVTVADATHGLIIEQPAQIAELIHELIENKGDASLSLLAIAEACRGRCG